MKICKKCPKTSIEFKNGRSFYHHEKTHDDEKNEVCVDCEKLFRTKTDLSSHRHSVHNQKDEYKCNHCEWIFSTKSNLKKHIKKINNGSQEEPDNSNSGGTINIVYKCTECRTLNIYDSFIRSQLILVAPCVIRQFCRYCPYSNKPVIWATVMEIL
jgi:hypothetical protein